MKQMTLTEKLDWLIDQWCERRELRPLQFLLRAYPGVLVHTDQFGQLLDCLNDEELTVVISLVNELEDFMKLRLGS